jgi:hypothetical protein
VWLLYEFKNKIAKCSMPNTKVVVMIKVKNPFVVNSIMPPEMLKEIQRYAMGLWVTNPSYSNSFGRHQWANTKELYSFHSSLLDLARERFESDTLQITWNLLSIYEGEQAKLWKHKDDNACTYHIDFCLFQKEPWDIWVDHNGESKPYTLNENDGLFMYGNDQEHWREAFPNPETNMVANAFFFFAEPEHWWFTKGPDYLSVIRNEITEEEYEQRASLA